jgi:hypothetical protein
MIESRAFGDIIYTRWATSDELKRLAESLQLSRTTYSMNIEQVMCDA